MNYSWEDEEQPPHRLNYGGYQPPEAPSLAKSAVTPNAVSGVGAATTSAGLATANPYVAAAGLGLQGVGTVLGAVGAYNQSEQADRDFKAQQDAYQFDKALSLEDRERAEEERRRRAELEAANYAGGYQNNAIQSYGGYNAMTGR